METLLILEVNVYGHAVTSLHQSSHRGVFRATRLLAKQSINYFQSDVFTFWNYHLSQQRNKTELQEDELLPQS